MNHFYTEPQFGEDWFDYQEVYSYFVEKCPNNGHIVEIGSWKGKSSAYMAVEIINSKKIIQFDCIDTWLGTDNDEYHKVSVQKTNNKLFELFLSNIKPVNNIINPIVKKSTDASLDYKDNSIDIVFIDADHSYNAVIQDVNCWLPKVKKNGILAGHDYITQYHHGVKKAIDQIFKKNISVKKTCWIYHKI